MGCVSDVYVQFLDYVSFSVMVMIFLLLPEKTRRVPSTEYFSRLSLPYKHSLSHLSLPLSSSSSSLFLWKWLMRVNTAGYNK